MLPIIRAVVGHAVTTSGQGIERLPVEARARVDWNCIRAVALAVTHGARQSSKILQASRRAAFNSSGKVDAAPCGSSSPTSRMMLISWRSQSSWWAYASVQGSAKPKILAETSPTHAGRR